MEPPIPTTSDLYFNALDFFDHQQDEILEQQEEDSPCLSELIKILTIDNKPQTQTNPSPLTFLPLPLPLRLRPFLLPAIIAVAIPLPSSTTVTPRFSKNCRTLLMNPPPRPTITLDRTIDSRDQTLESPPSGSILLSIVRFVIKAIFF